MKWKKFIAQLTIATMMMGLIPEYAVAAYQDSNDESEEVKAEAPIKLTNDYKEIINKRTEDSKTFTNGNGNFIKEIYPEAIHNKRNGTYHEISEDLVKTGTGYVTTEDTKLESNFPEKVKTDKPMYYEYKGHKLEFTNLTATDGKNIYESNQSTSSENKDNKITYKEIYPNIDLRHITLNNEVKEDWIIKKYNGIHQFNYIINTDLYGEVLSDGSVGFYENKLKEKLVFTLPAPSMMDSNINETKGEGTRSNNIHYVLHQINPEEYKLSLIADDSWLASDKRVFPIYVDPSVSIDALGDTYVSSAYPKANFNKQWDPTQGEYVLQTGYYDSTSGTNYAFIKFSMNDLKGASIDKAQLSTYVTHAYYQSEKNGLWVDEVNNIWHTDKLNWNNKPSSTKITSVNVGRNEWANFDVKSTVQAWMAGDRRNNGFKLHTNGHGKTYWKKISAAENTNKPKVTISYHYENGPKPTVTATAYKDGTHNGYTTVNWKSVYGATGYKLLMYDGSKYEEIYSGTATSWTSKGKKIFPMKPYKTTTTFKTDGTGVELPEDPSEFFAIKGTANYKEYKYRVVAVYPTGDGPQSDFAKKVIPEASDAPNRPIVKSYSYDESDKENAGRGWLDISWDKVENATGYKVLIWNGTKYEVFMVGGDTTSISTKGKKIWPTDDEIKAGNNTFHQAKLDVKTSVGSGSELPMYPGPTYGNTSKRFSIRIIATSAAGDSARSDINYGYIPLYAPKNVSIKSNEDNLVENKTSLSLNWDAVENAKCYEVTITSEKTGLSKTYQVIGKTNYTTDMDFAMDDTYIATVKSYYYNDEAAPEDEEDNPLMKGVKRSLSLNSKNAYVTPNMREDLLGLENYFTYEDDTFGKSSASVNVTTGNMVLQFTDDALNTRGILGYGFTRTYNSRATFTSALGKGWTFAGNEALSIQANGDVNYVDVDGTLHIFKKDGEQFTSPDGLYAKLIQVDDSTFTLTDKNQLVQTFKIGKKSNNYYISSYKNANENQIDFIRNEEDQLITVLEKNGTKSEISISYVDKKISKVQFEDHWTKYEYKGDLLVHTITGSDKTSSTITENYAYDNGQLTKYEDGKKNQTLFSYSKNELTIFDQQAKEDPEDISVTNTYQFNEEENEFNSIVTEGSKTIYKRDQKNNLYTVIEIVNSDGTISKQKYDDKYNLTESVNENGVTTHYKYDENGNLKEQTSTDGTITNEYNSHNQLTKSVDVTGEVTINLFEGPNLKSSTIGDETTSYEYDIYGRTTKTIYSNGTNEETKYDDDENKVTITDTKNNSVTTKYDSFGRKIVYIDGDGRTTSYEYDPIQLDVITAVINGNNQRTEYHYDSNGNLKTVKDALGQVKQYDYNLNDQIIKTIMPKTKNNNMEFNYDYNSNGDFKLETLPSGIKKHYEYTVMGDLETVKASKENGENYYWKQEYDDFGQLQFIKLNGNENPEKEFHYYEENGALKSYNLNNFTSEYQYDNNERLKTNQISYQNGTDEDSLSKTVSYLAEKDKFDEVKVSNGNTILQQYKYDENLLENNKTLTVNNGLYMQIQKFNKENLLGSVNYQQNGETVASFDYIYDKSGNIKEEKTLTGTSHYDYDGNNQLTKETLPNGDTIDYEYDKVGNRIKKIQNSKADTFEYNSANQIETKNGVSYSYDYDGNLTQDENYKYEYNVMGQQTRVVNLNGKEIASYEYDENGLRTKKIIGDLSHEYFYDNEVLMLEVVKKKNEVQEYRYYQWNGYTPLGVIIKEKDTSGEWKNHVFHYWTNQRGDVISIRDNVGKEVGSYEYDAYGNVISLEGDVAKDNPIRYAGYYYDEETKNYYLQARYYNPTNGTFLALDPHPGDDDEPLSQNGYTYANNNPVLNIDFNGKKASLRTRLRKQVKHAPKWARKILKEMFPNSSSVIGQKIATKSVEWGFAGAVTGEVVVRVSYWGKPKTLKGYGPIGAYGGFVVGSHVGVYKSLLPLTARYYIGVYLFGKGK
ncbi:DNRLRE domain-containing protein [Rummeliibacillus stabekisii]|uniref:DNRLRE domain-containing protein n=1 Tax=Rummeliibacillus stabekisii TaxID=241244 RepID=UPI003711B9D2